MELLQCKRNSAEYHRLTLDHFAAEHAHYYTLEDHSMRARLLDIRVNKHDYIGSRPDNLLHTDWLNAKKLVEVRYCLNFKTVCARRETFWSGETISLLGSFDGIQLNPVNPAASLIWVHIPYSASKHALIATMGWKAFIDNDTRSYLEHLLLIANAETAMLTLSDGTFANTLSYEYDSNQHDRFKILESYSEFSSQLKNMKRAEFNQHNS